MAQNTVTIRFAFLSADILLRSKSETKPCSLARGFGLDQSR
jgi:hypothetical protein